MAKDLYCVFCGKYKSEVRKLIEGPVTLICDGCIYLCVTVLIEGGIRPPWDKYLKANVEEIERWLASAKPDAKRLT